jgi:hypothetical protein
MGFLVNTSVHPFIQNRPDLLKGQVEIKASEYRFLQHNSFVDCVTLYPFDNGFLLDNRGRINQITKAGIINAVSISKTIEKHYKELILTSP